MSTPQEPPAGMYVESFFLEDEEAQIKGLPKDRRVFIECRSQSKHSDFDVVFVHALGADRFDTWRCGDVFWPDYIVDDSPGARVILFNYDTRVWYEPRLGTIREAANNLTSLVRAARRGSSRERRIIWVAHSLGGFLVKAACIPSTEVPHWTGNAPYNSLETSTSGAIFIGTPHRALFVDGWPSIFQRVYEVAGERPRTSLAANKPDSLVIEEVIIFLSRFHSVIDEHQMRIFSFYEQHETSGTSLPILVTSFQNGLFHPRETRETLPGNYLTMCRFQSLLDPAYERFKYSLEAIRSVPVDLNDSKDITPAALPQSNLEQNMVLAVQALEHDDKRTSQDDDMLMPLSVIRQFAPSVKLRRLKRFLAFPRSYVPSYPPIDSGDSQGYMTWILNSNEFKDWRNSDKLLVIRGSSGSGKSTLAHHIVRSLGTGWQRQGGAPSARKCVLSYFFRTSPNFDQTIVQMLNQFLLQFLEMMPSLVRHFPTRRVFARAGPSWPEWDAENATKDDEGVKELQLDIHRDAPVSESSHGFSHKDLIVSPFTILELVGIFISTLHDDQVGDVILVIDGLGDSSSRAQSQFQYFLNILESLRSKKVKVCLSCYTTQIQSLKPIIYLEPFPNEKALLGDSEDPGSVLYSWYETHEATNLASKDADALISNIRAIRLQSHLSLAIARQILKRLSSRHDIADFATYLKEWSLSTEHLETGGIDSLYEWVLNYLTNSAGWKQIGLLFLVAAAARSLTTLEARDLAPLAEDLASQYYQGVAKHIPTAPADQIMLLSDINTAQGVHALEARLLGLLRVTDDALVISHPTFKTFLLRKLYRNNLQFYFNYHIGMSCLRLIRDLKETSEGVIYSWQNRRHSVAIEKFSYPLRYWSTHIQAAHLSDEWESSQSVETLRLLSVLWDNAEIRGLMREFSQVTLPPITELPLSCLLVSCNLSKTLDMYYNGVGREKNPAGKYLTLDQRCAAVNFAHDALKILKKHNRANNLNDQYGKSLRNYESWARSREFAEQSLPGWMFESLSADIAEGRRWDAIKQMLKEPAELMRLRSNSYLDQLLLLAIRRCDEEVATELLNNGADCDYIDQDDPHKPSILHIAAALGDADLVRELIYHGSRMSITDAFGMRPIHWAAERGHHIVVKLLISPSSDSEAKFGQNPLFMACESVSQPTVLVLLRFGSSINFPDNQQRTPIHVASAAGSTDMVRLLLSKGANAEARDDRGITPLHLAAFGGWTGVVDELLSAGVFTDALTAGQQTPLHFACESPNPSLAVVLALLQRQSDPHSMDLEGMTPLHIAVRKGSVAMVELFLKCTPSPHDMNKLLALAERNKEITQTLLRRQQDPPYRLKSPVEHSQLPYEGNRSVNVVFVHGYFHSPDTTWSDGSFKFTWPEKYLPTSEARARVFFWDRLLELTDFSSLGNLHELGKRLSDYVVHKVYSDEVTSHSVSGSGAEPLVFVSHSLGGLVVKAAVAEATHNRLLANTKGIVFLGTPHMGLDPYSLNEAVGKLVQRAVNNRLDPGRGVLSYQGDARRNRTGKNVDNYNKLESNFMKTCSDRHIKVLTFAEEASQLVPLDCAFYPPSFAPNLTVNKKHESLGRVDDTHDIVYVEILRFLLTVLAERRRSESKIKNLPGLDSRTHVLQVTPLRGNVLSHRPQESSQPFSEEIPDVSIALKRNPTSYVPDISKAVDSSLLKHLERDSELDAGEPEALKEWRHKPENRALWVLGKPGSGKTIFMAQLFNRLKESSGHYQTVAAFFFSGRSPGQKTAVDMLRSILLQILHAREDLVDIVRHDSEYYNVLVGPSLSWSALISVYHKTIRIALDLASDSEFIFLLDALDECNSSDGEGSSSGAEVCLFIQDCLHRENIKVCFASRPRNEFFIEFDDRVPKLRIEDFNHGVIAQYVERRLAETGASSGKTSKTSEALAMDVTQRSQGFMLWAVLTVENVLRGLKNGDTDEQLNRRIQGTPVILNELYKKMVDNIPLAYRREAARTLRIVAIAPFPLAIEVLSLAIDDYQVSDEGRTAWRNVRSNLRAINIGIGVGEPGRGDGSEDEEQKNRAAMRVNSRCGGLLSVRDNKDIRFIHYSAKAFILQPHNIEGLLEGSTDADFDPPVNLLSACIIRIKQSVDKGWLETANQDERLTHLVSQAFAAAVLADANHKARRFYLQLFDELVDVCWRIRHLQPVQSTNSDQLTIVPGPSRIQDIPRDLYATLFAIWGGMWSYLRDTVDERIMTLGDTSHTSLFTYLINPKDLGSLPWAACTIRSGTSRELPPDDVVRAFFAADNTPPWAWARVTERPNAWREVLESGYHVFARDEVPCNPGPAQTYENGSRWVKIVGIFLEEGADVDAVFPKVPFKLRADLTAPLGGSYADPARAASTTTTQPTSFRTLEPRRTLQDVMWPQRDYAVEYKRYLNTINETSKTGHASSPEPPASPGRSFSGTERSRRPKILRSGSRFGNKTNRVIFEETNPDKAVAIEPPSRTASGDMSRSGRAGHSVSNMFGEVVAHLPRVSLHFSARDRNRSRSRSRSRSGDLC